MKILKVKVRPICVFLSILYLISCHQATGTHSSESDEEGIITFVTENDTYEDDDDIHLEPNILGSYTERCPPFPEFSFANRQLCGVKRCIRDEECNNTFTKFICCFNGCIFACALQVEPPPPFDWLEETLLKDDIRNSTFRENEFEDYRIQTKSLMSARGASSELSLPGGCFLTSQQYENLLMFKKHNHVRSCACSNKEVVCSVNET